jgi:radical SAM superfamily enzyme YgiQ (UPF0313 family)
MRVLLVYPNANRELIGWGDLGAIAEPLALEYVAAAARADGHEVEILDLRLHPGTLEMAAWGFAPDVVGVTGYSMHVLRNLAICTAVKKVVPHCRTVVGGHHATLLPEDFFEPQIDFVVCGEGGRAFRRILRGIEAGETPLVPGVWSRCGDEFISGGKEPPLEIDEIVPPERALVPADRERYFIDWMQPIALLRTTVGCPYRCSFCSLWRIMDGRYYRRDVARVVDELATIDEPYVFLVDDEPFVNPARMHELALAIAASGLRKEYFAYCRIDSFLRDRKLFEQWRDVGLRRLFFGVETIFDDELADYNKRQEQQQIRDAVLAARDIGIQLFCSFIIKPVYSRERFAQVADFIRETDIDYPSFTILTPLPGTGVPFDAVIPRQANGRPNWEHFDLQHAVTRTLLPPDEFMREYRALQNVFSESYRNARHPFYIDRVPAAAP